MNTNKNFKNARSTKMAVTKAPLRAECREMCPEEEKNMRIKNNLVNKLEKSFLNK
jgi:hypothetical protein